MYHIGEYKGIGCPASRVPCEEQDERFREKVSNAAFFQEWYAIQLGLDQSLDLLSNGRVMKRVSYIRYYTQPEEKVSVGGIIGFNG